MRLHYERAFWTATTGAADTAWVDAGTACGKIRTFFQLYRHLVPSASHVTDDEICKRLEGLTPIQKKAALDLLDTYIGNLPYLTNEE